MTARDGVGTTRARFFDLPLGKDGFRLSSGRKLGAVRLSYELYGELSPDCDNVVLVFHALSGSQHAAGRNVDLPEAGDLWTEECHLGWWDAFVGPGRAVDTRRFCVLCVNYLGGCYGSTGPASVDPETGKPFGARFPHLTASDVVDTQIALLDHLGVGRLHAVIGNSVGGLLGLNLAVRYPERVSIIINVASALRISPLQRILTLEQILAIENDPDFRGGDYYDGEPPHRGLALARMISHKTFISLRTMERRARREIVDHKDHLSWYEIDTPLESYMLHQGRKFVRRFDANTYLRILDIWQKFDLIAQAREETGASDFVELFSRCRHQQYLVFSISSDVCFYPDQQAHIVDILRAAAVPNIYITVHSEKGHDSFLLEPELYAPHLDHTLHGS